MSKWKCGICNNEFDNFQAQGFGGTIYCPLCYFKELYRRTELERERLNNIIDELEKKVEQLENIRKEIKEYIEKNVVCCKNSDMLVEFNVDDLLNILNKGYNK